MTVKFDLDAAYDACLKLMRVDFTYKPWSISTQFPNLLEEKYLNFDAITNVDQQGRTWVLQRDWDMQSIDFT